MTIALDNSLPKPDFLIIGTQKGGTTWLRKVLLEHESIYIPPYPEEVHFFNRSLLQPDLYLALFNTVEARHKLLGEKSPNYFHMPEKCIRFLHTLLPNTKLIVLLRNPVERAWSQARMHSSSFNQRALGQKDLLKLVLQVTSRGNFERTNYAKVLQKWLKYFPKEQVLVYFYNDLQKDPQLFLNRVCQDLEIASFQPAGLAKKVHVSKKMEMPDWLHWLLVWRYRKTSDELAALGYPSPAHWKEPAPAIAAPIRILMLCLFFGYDLLTKIVYWLYKWRMERKIVVPNILYN